MLKWRCLTLAAAVAIYGAVCSRASAAPDAACNVMHSTVHAVSLPASPFAAIASADGCTIFVSLQVHNRNDRAGAVAALKRSDGYITAGAAVMLDRTPTGMALTHDGALLLVADGEGLTFIDAARLAAGDKDAKLGRVEDGRQGSFYVAVTPDDRFAFVSDEDSGTLSVINLETVRASGFDTFAVVGQIHLGKWAVGLAVSPDGRTLYAATEVVTQRDWPGGCRGESARETEHPQGAIFVIDVQRAEKDPSDAVMQRVPASCNPVRLVLSPKGDRLYATARGSDTLLAFDTTKLAAGAADAQIASIPVGEAPVGVTTLEGGAKVIVANSNRFTLSGRDTNQTLTVIDAGKVGSESGVVLGTVDVGGFPRELSVTADGKTLLVTNFGTNSLYLIDVASLPIRQ